MAEFLRKIIRYYAMRVALVELCYVANIEIQVLYKLIEISFACIAKANCMHTHIVTRKFQILQERSLGKNMSYFTMIFLIEENKE